MTALLVARPLVLGDALDAQTLTTDISSFLMGLLTLGTAIAWAGWRFWSKHSRWYAGLVEVGLLLIVAGAFVGTTVAANKHSAWLAAWDWVVLLVGFHTLRQLAVGRTELHGFTTAVLATAVALAFTAVYQASITLPALQMRWLAEEAALREGKPIPDPIHPLDSPDREGIRERIFAGHVDGAFAHPNSFAGYLVLVVPGLFALAWLARHVGRPYAQRMLILFFAVVGLIALYLTHSRGAWLALLIAVVGVGLVLGRRWLAANPAYILAGLVAVVAVVYLIVATRALTSGLNKDTASLTYRLEYWSATAKILREHPVLGVGPGNFGTAYKEQMSPAAKEKIKDPHNLFLEMWATHGLLGLAGLLLVIGAFLWRCAPLLRDPGPLLQDDRPPETGEPPVRWEFYVGGALGLILAFALRAAALPGGSQEIVLQGVEAGGRTVLWFVAFALFEPVAWPPRLRALVLGVGVLALLGNLVVSGGIGFPSVVGMLLACLALTLNSLSPRQVAVADRYSTVSTTLPLPAVFALLMVYIAGVVAPTLSAAAYVRQSTTAGARYIRDLARPPEDRAIKGNLHEYLQGEVIAPLLRASELDPYNPQIASALSLWYFRLWEWDRWRGEIGDTAVVWATRAQLLDPGNRDGYASEALIRGLFARRILEHRELAPPGARFVAGSAFEVNLLQREQNDEKVRAQLKRGREQYQFAAQALERYQQHDPSDAAVAFEIAGLYAQARDWPSVEKQARRARELDKAARNGPRSLSDRQRAQLRAWLGEADST